MSDSQTDSVQRSARIAEQLESDWGEGFVAGLGGDVNAAAGFALARAIALGWVQVDGVVDEPLRAAESFLDAAESFLESRLGGGDGNDAE